MHSASEDDSSTESKLTCIILAGGYGKRLWPLTRSIAKPLLPIGDRVVLDYIMDRILELKEITRVIISTNLKFRKDFEKWMRKYRDVDIELVADQSSREEEKPGALKSLSSIISNISSDCLVIAGDNLFTSSLKSMIRKYGELNAPLIALYDIGNLSSAKMYGVVEIDHRGRIINFEEKPENPRSSLVSTGIYVYPHYISHYMKKYLEEGGEPDKLGSFIEWLHKRITVYGHLLEGEWWDIGSIETYHDAVEKLAGRHEQAED